MNSALKRRIGCNNHAWIYQASLYRSQSSSIRLSHRYVRIRFVLYQVSTNDPFHPCVTVGLGDVGGSFQLCICSTWRTGKRPTEFVWWWLGLLVVLLLIERPYFFSSIYSLSDPIENIGTLNEPPHSIFSIGIPCHSSCEVEVPCLGLLWYPVSLGIRLAAVIFFTL